MDANPNTRTKNTSRRGATLVARIIQVNGKDLEIVASQQWMCAYIKGGAEFNIASICMNKRIAFFVPLLEYSDRVYRSLFRNHSRPRFKPLWPDYIFCRLNEYQKRNLRASPSIVRLMKVADEHELLAYLKQFTSVNKIVPCGKNDPVVFRRGLFGGMRGKVEDILEKESMFKIAVEMLGSIQHLKVAYDEVTPVWGYSENTSFRPAQVLQQTAPAQTQEPTSAPLNDIISQHIDAITAELIKHLAKHPNLLYQLEPRRSFLQMLGMEDLRRRFSEPPPVVRL
jgi:transcription antitermination factor NusG